MKMCLAHFVQTPVFSSYHNHITSNSKPFTDDIVKAGQKERKAASKKATAKKEKAAAKKAPLKKTKVKAGGAAKAAAKPKGKAATKAATKKGKKGGMDVESNKSKKLAAVTGKSKAQRGAKVANKRGMALTGVASVKDIKATIQREAIKLAKTMVGGNGAKGNNARSGKGGNNNPRSIKVSFRPSELSRSTNKNTQAQIGALLSKAPKKGGNRQNIRQPGAERRVVLK